jgi:hypothetical protein
MYAKLTMLFSLKKLFVHTSSFPIYLLIAFILRPIRFRKPHHFVPFLFLFLGATEARFSVKDYVDMPSSALFGELGRVDIFVSDASSQPRYRFCRPDFTYLKSGTTHFYLLSINDIPASRKLGLCHVSNVVVLRVNLHSSFGRILFLHGIEKTNSDFWLRKFVSNSFTYA